MKKFFKAAVSALLVSLVVFSAAACGGNNGGSGDNGGTNSQVDAATSEIVGTWKMSFDETKVTDDMKAYASMYQSIVSSVDMTATFNADGTVDVQASLGAMTGMLGSAISTPSEPQKGTGKWTREGDKVIISEMTSGMSIDPTGMGGTVSAASDKETKAELVLKDGKLIVEGQEMLPFVKQ